MARRLRGDEVVHEGDHVRRVHVKDGGLVVLRQADLAEVTTRPHHIIRVGRGCDDLGMSGRGGGAVLLAARSLRRSTSQLTGTASGGAPRAPITVGPMHVTTSARDIAKVGDALGVRLAHVHEAVFRRVEQVLRGTREQSDSVETVGASGRCREDEGPDKRPIART